MDYITLSGPSADAGNLTDFGPHVIHCPVRDPALSATTSGG